MTMDTFFGLLLSILLFLMPGISLAQGAYVKGEVIVKLKGQASTKSTYAFLGKAQSAKGMTLKRSFSQMQMYHYSLKAGKSVEQAIAELKTDPNVEYAEPNYLLSKASVDDIQAMSSEEIEALTEKGGYVPTDANIGVMEARQILSEGDSDPPIVAIIDTGLDITHKIFVESEALWTNPDEIAGNGIDDDGNGYVDDVHGWNFVHGSSTMIDDDGHGTHVAGIVLSVSQDIFSEPFKKSSIQIMPLKFLDKNGVGSTSHAISAIHYAIENGAHILNNSWGGKNYSAALHEAVAYTYSQGVIFVAAAGNSGTDNDYTPIYPSSYEVPHVMSIAATTSIDELAPFSNFGPDSVDLGSPGVFIVSSIPGNRYGISSGTSMATPFVSGVASLMLIDSPEMLGYQLKSIIFQEADHVGSLESKLSQEGRINALSAIEFAKQVSIDSSQPHYKFTSADRDIAALSAGGCGTVNPMYTKMQGKRGPASDGRGYSLWRVLLFVGIILIPILLTQWLRWHRPASHKRRYDRFKVDSDIKVNIMGENLVGSISTISLGGVQLNTEAMLEQGGIVTMSVASPDGKEQIQVQGRVVWRKEQEAYGVAFEKAEPSTFKSLAGWATSLSKLS